MQQKEFQTVKGIILRSSEPMDLHPGLAPTSISDYERQLGTQIPQGYRMWLEFSDGGEIFVPGVEFFRCTLDEDSLQYRNGESFRGQFSIPASYMIIGMLNYGDLLCMCDDSDEILVWDYEQDRRSFAYRDFGDLVTEQENLASGADLPEWEN